MISGTYKDFGSGGKTDSMFHLVLHFTPLEVRKRSTSGVEFRWWRSGRRHTSSSTAKLVITRRTRAASRVGLIATCTNSTKFLWIDCGGSIGKGGCCVVVGERTRCCGRGTVACGRGSCSGSLDTFALGRKWWRHRGWTLCSHSGNPLALFRCIDYSICLKIDQ